MRIETSALAQHLEHPLSRAHIPADAFTGAAGGAACGDLVRVSVAVEQSSSDGLVADAGFDASGCGAAIAAGSAVVSLVRARPLLEAARVGADEIAEELGGLGPAKRHAAELAADALHRALGAAAAARAALASDPDRQVVAMSGGVDSAVAALVVARGGARAVGLTVELWSDPDNDGERSCCSPQAVRGARALAHRLGLPHFSLELRDEFRRGVVEPWLTEQGAGLTPNPCIRCNGGVRLDAMVAFAQRLGAPSLATGHYARVREGDDGVPLLRVAADGAKDQSYMLAALAPGTLARLRFPLGDLHKSQVRELAHEAGLPVADKPDSQDLCFLAGTGRTAFLARHGGTAERPGPIVDRRGTVLGRHRGHHEYTVGQRRGLGLSGGSPVYVLATDPGANTVTVGSRAELAAHTVAVRDVTLHRDGSEVDSVRLRYHGNTLPCRLSEPAGPGFHPRLNLRLSEPADAVAPGQSACLMSGELILGQGTIARSR